MYLCMCVHIEWIVLKSIKQLILFKFDWVWTQTWVNSHNDQAELEFKFQKLNKFKLKLEVDFLTLNKYE